MFRTVSVRAAASAAFTVALWLAVFGQGAGWHAKPDVVKSASAEQPGINFDESKVGTYELPPLLQGPTGKVTTRDAWPARRKEILDLFREQVYGRTFGRPERLRFETIEKDAHAMDGAATLERIAVISSQAGREHRFELTIFLPNAGTKPVPLLLLLNNRPRTNTDPTRKEKSGFWPAEEVIARGYGIAALQNNELAPDNKNRYREGVIQLFESTTTGERAGDAPAALAAWAWGASRAMDYFETDSRIDAKRVAVLGHSRGGKAALWAGAEDERFALVISNESGEGGAALSRRNFGETLAKITTTFPHWFARNYERYAGRVATLPVDQHMLMGLIAPRALYVASADEDLWSDPRGEFLSLADSSPVFALWGDKAISPGEMPGLSQPLVRGRRGYHIRPGTHNLTPYDWQRFIDFANTVWK
jgi:hypothetical protein